MSRLRHLLPADNLGRTRLAAVIIACLGLGSDLAQLSDSAIGPLWNTMGVMSILLIVGAIVLTWSRGRAPWWDSVTLPVLIAIGGSSLEDPLSALLLALAIGMVLSLYGPTHLWVIRTIGSFLAVPVAVAVNHTSLSQTVTWHSGSVLALMPQLMLMSVMMRGIYLALLRQERAGARDAVLARTGARMLGATDVESIRRYGLEAVQEILVRTPGVAMIVLRRNETGLYLHNLAGLPEELRGRSVPEAALTEPGLLREVAPAYRHWVISSLGPDLHQVVAGRKALPHDILDAFRTVANQLVLAEAAVRSRAELDHRAHHDHLTQLPTRAKFLRLLAAAVAGHPPGTVALLNVDLDDFKAVNDTYGHGAGDELLVEVAARLTALGGPGATAARYGGDEFAVLLTGLDRPGEADAVAARLGARLSEPLVLTAATVTVGASIGVAVSTSGDTAAALTRRADVAMYAVKARRKNREPARHEAARRPPGRLCEAIARDEITLRFRPELDLRTGACTGVDAQGYWEHPELGPLGPADLLMLAGRTGELPTLSRYLLGSACAQFATVPGGARLWLGVDVAARQLLEPGFGDGVLDVVTSAGLDPARLSLRVVDGAGIGSRAQLGVLTTRGVRLALDSATTAAATVASLSSHPGHRLTADAADPAGLRLVLALGRTLGSATLVQGVDSADQLDRLRVAGVAAVQGDAVAPPMSAAELGTWLAARPAMQPA